MHIVGLGFDPDNAALAPGAGRHARRAGRTGAGDGGPACAEWASTAPTKVRSSLWSNPELISAPTLRGFGRDPGVPRHERVFRKYLTEGKPGYVPHRWATLGDAVRWITGLAWP